MMPINPAPIPAMNTPLQMIAYAYPTSFYANKHNRGNGFYFIEIIRPHGVTSPHAPLSDTENRFETAQDAEAAADKIGHQYHPLYTSYPQPGSKFWPGKR